MSLRLKVLFVLFEAFITVGLICSIIAAQYFLIFILLVNMLVAYMNYKLSDDIERGIM